ncbi:DUF2637 domain-containing protein [Micromonospora sp. HNM0581]|uniref:DUF2637 domain-containing protein n=1 Tax=Micromonospora sp. HNM0581 TaxID=2716341 RepID=UPI00146DDEA5|nr:DUF2637 domain-containing protein [Micromonospora sp. HNM0581]NLU77808.1 DUF2637 domain-containing protein [Micromonospora sp. HNM0581]
MVHVENVDAALPERPSKGAWVVAWSAFAAGIGASLAANIAHAGDGVGAKFVAGWPPLALLLCSEVMMRVPAPRHPLVRAMQIVGTVIVAGVAAVASYRHMKALALEYGEDSLTASTLPLSVDGLALVASIGLVVLAHQRRTAIVAERAAAWAAALPPPAPVPVPMPADAVPPAGADASPEPVPLPDPEPLPDPDPVPLPVPDPEPVPDAVPLPTRTPEPRLPLPRLEPVVPPHPWPRQQPLPLPPDPSPDPAPVPPDAATEELWAAARQVWKDSAAAGAPLTGQALGSRFGRSERWGRNRIKEARAELEATGDVAGEPDQQDAPVPAGTGVV